MKVIIAGSRTITDYQTVIDAVDASGWDLSIDEIVSGGAGGVDVLGIRYARDHNIPFQIFFAEWSKYGRSAGYRRNEQMAEYVAPDGGLIAVWDGYSVGTHHMIDIARKKGLQIYVHSTPGSSHLA